MGSNASPHSGDETGPSNKRVKTSMVPEHNNKDAIKTIDAVTNEKGAPSQAELTKTLGNGTVNHHCCIIASSPYLAVVFSLRTSKKLRASLMNLDTANEEYSMITKNQPMASSLLKWLFLFGSGQGDTLE
ncbi:hypothetical protein A6R68_04582, partial [Neotoma lepida]